MTYHAGERIHRIGFWTSMLLASLLLWGCAHHVPLPREPSQWVYQAALTENKPNLSWAPAFVVYGHADEFNRIGRPTAVSKKGGREKIFVDPSHPVFYAMTRTFTTAKATYTNQIYRIHFPKVPFSLIPFNITYGKNVGILVVVTLDSAQRPVLVTTVGTCGCYMVIVPTEHLSPDAYPKDWDFDKPLEKYGERLPAVLRFQQTDNPKIVVHLRPGVHRVMDLEVRRAQDLTGPGLETIHATIEPIDALEQLPLNGGHTSFYHQDGSLKGYVKGSLKLWETLLMSLISLDFFVGTDKAYAESAERENPFYTSLKPWRRQDSNMWDFVRFLEYWGWDL